MDIRLERARVDDDDTRRKVAIAREMIYQKNIAVDNDDVNFFLKKKSLVPTAVGKHTDSYIDRTLIICAE